MNVPPPIRLAAQKAQRIAREQASTPDNLQKLLARFPEESAQQRVLKRITPYLPFNPDQIS